MWLALVLAGCQATPKGGQPSPTAPSCATGELLDGEVCVPEACATGRWGAVVDAVVYVDVMAGDGGDGSEGAPLRSIQAGLELAVDRDGGIVAVAAGTYVETITMGSTHDGVTLAGRCRERVTVDGSEGDDEDPAIEIIGERRAPEIAIEGLTVTGGRHTALWVQHATVSVRGSDVRGNTMAGVLATDATVTLDGVGVYDTLPDAHGEFGRGINAQDGASLTATRCTVQGNTDVGVFAGGAGTTVALADTRVLDTSPGPDGTGGRGIGVEDGASLTATGCTVQGNAEVGVFVARIGSTVDLVDTAVLDTLPRADGTGGAGVEVGEGAALTATRCTVERNAAAGVVAGDAGTTVDLVSTSVLDTVPSAEGDSRGILAEDGAALTATACTIQGNHGVGVDAQDAGTTVALVDTAVLDTSAPTNGTTGCGISINGAASLTTINCTIQGNAQMGVFASGAGTSVNLMETGVIDTSPSPDGTGDRGIGVQDGAALVATGCTIQGNTGAGVFAANPGTTVELTDTEILDTLQIRSGNLGRGIDLQDGARLIATACTLQGNTEGGVLAMGAHTSVDLVDTAVLGTRRGRVTGFAIGVGAAGGAVLHAVGCDVSETEGPGLYVASGGQIRVEGTVVTGNLFAGAVILDGDMTLADSAITGTLPDAEWGGGLGVYATGYFGRATLALADSTVGPHDYAAVWLDGQGSYDLERNLLSGSDGVDRDGWILHGNAVFAERGVTAWDGASGLRLSGNTFDGASEVAVLLDGAASDLDGNLFSGNGVDLRQQRCSGIVALTEVDPDWEICPDGDLLTAYDLVFTSLYLPEVEPLE